MKWSAKTDKNQREIVDALRNAGRLVWLTHRLGQGFPDIAVTEPVLNQIVLVEVKQPKTGRLTEDEWLWLKQWYERGAGVVLIATSFEDYTRQIETIASAVKRGEDAWFAAKQLLLKHPVTQRTLHKEVRK